MNSLIKITLIVTFTFSLQSCHEISKINLRKLSTEEVVERLKNGKIDQYKLSHKGSIGNNLTKELSVKFNQGLMIRYFYENSKNEVTQAWLTEFAHERVFMKFK
ncbi:MAG: hypothetical protein ACI86M_002823 [Saprospiraceae bacterium]|jgi:hypothetical protein